MFCVSSEVYMERLERVFVLTSVLAIEDEVKYYGATVRLQS